MRALSFVWIWLIWPGMAASSESRQSLLDAYFSVFETKAADPLPLAEDATFFGSLLSEPIVGRDEVVAFLNRVAPSVQLKEVKQSFESDEGACAELVFLVQADDLAMEEAHCLKIRDGEIQSIRLYYDPRPLLEDSGN